MFRLILSLLYYEPFYTVLRFGDIDLKVNNSFAVILHKIIFNINIVIRLLFLAKVSSIYRISVCNINIGTYLV